ncbi:MAG: thioredoxin family protein [Candidatus Methanoperedens sp.]|jgi:glutaredoxin-like protein|nr:thioredoxin family protein [Candidatus Methanoperedens sp.]PKL53595.1 MAG: glutaredoxin [Candidatus Methanoperedenaceae archaeon HGW-Methanoperedenaceae-1]
MVFSDAEKKTINKKFESLVNDVQLVMFTQEHECHFCKETRDMVEGLGGLSPKIKTTVYDLVNDKDMAKKYNIDKIPAIAIIGQSDYGIRYYGAAAGYEFNVVLDDIVDVSKGTTPLPDAIKNKLAGINKPVHVQVFVSPTCPYCPAAARTSRRLAIENKHIRSDVLEMTEFPHLVQKYSVMSVPHIIINEDTSFVGAQPPEVFVEQILMALRSGNNPMYS